MATSSIDRVCWDFFKCNGSEMTYLFLFHFLNLSIVEAPPKMGTEYLINLSLRIWLFSPVVDVVQAQATAWLKQPRRTIEQPPCLSFISCFAYRNLLIFHLLLNGKSFHGKLHPDQAWLADRALRHFVNPHLHCQSINWAASHNHNMDRYREAQNGLQNS